MAVYAELAKLSLPNLVSGLAETIVTTDQLVGVMPLFNIAPSIQYQWNRENTLGVSTNSGSIILADGTFTPNTASYTTVTQDLTFFGASFSIPKTLATDEALSAELNSKAKLVARAIGYNTFYATSGTGNAQFTGFAGTVSGSSTQDIATHANASGAFSLGALDQAIGAVKTGRANVIVMNNTCLRYFKSAVRTAAGGATLDTIQMENYSMPFLAYDGIPIVVSDFPIKDINGGESVYVLYTNELDGITYFSNYENVISVTGPTPVINSVSDNYTVASSMGLIIPSSLSLSRVHGILS